MLTGKTFTLPHDPLTPLDPVSRPTSRTVRLLRKELYANLCSVSSDLGGGDHGHLGMVMPQASYTAISTGGAAYIHPVPPVAPNYAGTAAVIANMQQQYAQEKKEYQEYKELSNQLKALLLTAVPAAFIRPLSHPQLGFANATPQTIMNHLIQTYGAIEESDLLKNTEELQAPWNPDTPIEDVFARGTFCRDFAEEGEDPITDATYTRYLVQLFDKSGVLEKAVDGRKNQKPTRRWPTAKSTSMTPILTVLPNSPKIPKTSLRRTKPPPRQTPRTSKP
jgi:hypothetical protein